MSPPEPGAVAAVGHLDLQLRREKGREATKCTRLIYRRFPNYATRHPPHTSTRRCKRGGGCGAPHLLPPTPIPLLRSCCAAALRRRGPGQAPVAVRRPGGTERVVREDRRTGGQGGGHVRTGGGEGEGGEGACTHGGWERARHRLGGNTLEHRITGTGSGGLDPPLGVDN